MKKWGILGLVILGGLLLGLQHYINKGEKTQSVMQSQPGQANQVGVALPPDATGYVPAESSYNTAAGNYNDLSVPASQSGYKGACPGSSLAEILAAHGKIWGYFTPKSSIAFEFKDNEVIYKFLGDYAGCVATARDDISVCDTLPGELNTEMAKIPLDGSLYTQCRKKAGTWLFYSYLAGKIKGRDSCNAALAGIRPHVVARVSLPDLCEAAAKGPDAAREFLLKAMPKEKHRKTIMRKLPESKASCAGNADCLNRFNLYSIVKDGKVSACPRADAAYCEAVINRASTPCEAIVKDMSKAYCASVERIKKKSGGFIGVSKDEMQTQIAQIKTQKAAAELQKKEEEKILTETNKKAKKILGKE
jgi:hypothetical protein